MENICNGQNGIHIILTWIMRAISKVLKEALKAARCNLQQRSFGRGKNQIPQTLSGEWFRYSHGSKLKTLWLLEIKKQYLKFKEELVLPPIV